MYRRFGKDRHQTSGRCVVAVGGGHVGRGGLGVALRLVDASLPQTSKRGQVAQHEKSLHQESVDSITTQPAVARKNMIEIAYGY
jgi:hypothetical protein